MSKASPASASVIDAELDEPCIPPWPFDNSVAGGIPSGLGIFESVVKESSEEASIPEDIVQKYAKAAGVVSYFYR